MASDGFGLDVLHPADIHLERSQQLIASFPLQVSRQETGHIHYVGDIKPVIRSDGGGLFLYLVEHQFLSKSTKLGIAHKASR